MNTSVDTTILNNFYLHPLKPNIEYLYVSDPANDADKGQITSNNFVGNVGRNKIMIAYDEASIYQLLLCRAFSIIGVSNIKNM